MVLIDSTEDDLWPHRVQFTGGPFDGCDVPGIAGLDLVQLDWTLRVQDKDVRIKLGEYYKRPVYEEGDWNGQPPPQIGEEWTWRQVVSGDP